MPTPFRRRLNHYIGAPAHQFRYLGHRYGLGFVWSSARDRAKRRWHLPRKWYYDNDAVTAYGINMRLAMRREARRGGR